MQLPYFGSVFTRRVWLKLHLYLALSIGFCFALLGLTGSISIYSEEIDRWLNPELVITPSQPLQSIDKIRLALRIEHPKRYGSWTIELPQRPDGVIIAWFDKPHETIDQAYAPLMVAINPYTAEIISNRFWGQTLTTWIIDLHSQLLLGATGRKLVGAAGALLLLSLSTGLYLWWPERRQWLSVFRISQSKQQLLFNIHRLSGLTSIPGLLVLALTGILLSYPSILSTLFGASGMEHGSTGKDIISTANPSKNATTLSDAIFLARAPFPKAEVRRITTPAGETGIYRINLRQASELNRRHPFTTVWVDRWSGQIKQVQDPQQFSLGERIASGIWPIHTGEALGSNGRLLWFISGQLLFWLYITGLLRWLYRRGVLSEEQQKLRFIQTGQLRVPKQWTIIYQTLTRQLKQHWQLAYPQVRQRIAVFLRRLAVRLQIWSNKFD